MKLIKFTPLALALSLVVHQSQGAVVLQDFYAAGSPGGTPTDLGGGTFGYEIDLTSSFSAAGHGKLVMVYSSKDGTGNGSGGDNGGAPVSSISYGGFGLDTAIYHVDEAGSARATVGIYFLDNVTADGILRIELGDQHQTEFGFGLYALDGLKAGVQDTDTFIGSGTPTTTVSLTTSSGFLVHEAARNNQSLVASGEDDWETLYNYSVNAYRGLSQYQVVDGTGPGDYSAPINNTGNFKRVSAAAFEVIPEPSVAILGAMGSVLLLRRRR